MGTTIYKNGLYHYRGVLSIKLKRPISCGDTWMHGKVHAIMPADDRHSHVIVRYKTVPDKYFLVYID